MKMHKAEILTIDNVAGVTVFMKICVNGDLMSNLYENCVFIYCYDLINLHSTDSFATSGAGLCSCSNNLFSCTKVEIFVKSQDN